MAKIKYIYDTDSSQFRVVEGNPWTKIVGAIGVVITAFGLAVLMVIAYDSYFELPTELRLRKEIGDMEVNYEKLDHQLNSLQTALTSIEKRDDHVYRMVLGTEPIDQAVRKGGVGGVDRYMEIRDKRMAHTDLIVELNTKVDRLRRKLYIESNSQDELIRLAEDKKDLYASIPAIQPISNKHLKALSSGFGLRFHPFYKVIVMHSGLDFSAPEGTPIFATADGQVVAADTAVYGYGKMITVDHGHGYVTRYAHVREFAVTPGTRVKRGDQIAFVGNTGMSTASHLHYEVLLHGTQINPIHHFFNDLNPEEYEQITKLASVPNQLMGN